MNTFHIGMYNLLLVTSVMIYKTHASESFLFSISVTDAVTEQMGWGGLSCDEASNNIQPSVFKTPPPVAVSKRVDAAIQRQATTKSVAPGVYRPATLWPALATTSPTDPGRDHYDTNSAAYYKIVCGSEGRYTYNAGCQFLTLNMESFLKDTFEDDDVENTPVCDLADGLFQAMYGAVDDYSQSLQYLDYNKMEGCQSGGGLNFHVFVNDWTGYKLLEIKASVDHDDERPQELRTVGPHSTSSLQEHYLAWRQAHPCGPSSSFFNTEETTYAVKKVTSSLTSRGFIGWSFRRLLYTPIGALRLGGLVGHLVAK